MVLQDLDQLEEARDLLREAYRASLRWLGAEHPQTKTIKANLDALQ
jgi:hypothetical protein